MTLLAQPPSPSRVLGANPYAEQVIEQPNGMRWVKTLHGWLDETACEPLRVCRATTVDELQAALASLCRAPVAQAFDQNWMRAYVVWSAPRGAPTPNKVLHPQSARQFVDQVIRLQADHGWRQWVGNAPLPWGRLKWGHVINAVGLDGWPMGLVAGVARRLGLQGEEWGLQGAGASLGKAGWKVEAHPRTSWPTPPDGQASFHGHLTRKAPPGYEGVVWWSAQRRALWPDTGLRRWWAWWAREGQGWWVLDQPLDPAVVAFAAQLQDNARPYTRHVIVGTSFEVWQIGVGTPQGMKVEHALSEWAGPALVNSQETISLERDGRLPYAPASTLPPSEAWGPTGLVHAMEEGLGALQAVYGSVDEKVCALLGRPMDTLGEALSAEQVDGVAMASARLEEGRAFLLADETGFGKGRALASLALAGLAQGRTVVILTERKQLFSDLYRDLKAVSVGEPPRPLLFHGQADIRNAQGRVEIESPRGKKFQELLKKHAWDHGQDRLVFTTYAQLARGKVKEKMAWLKERMGKNAWVLLDESHNAAGASQVGEQVDRLIDRASGVVHASATFVRGEGNLGAYRRALPWGPASLPWIKSALAHDPGPLRQVLVEEIARAGLLLRREHPPVPPPSTVWITPTAAQEQAMAAFVQTWQTLFVACEQWEIAQSGRSQLAWMKIGAVMSRSVREFLLWLKADALVERLVDLKAANRKSVVAVDSTMEAALREVLDARPPLENDEVDDDITPPSGPVIAEGVGAPPLWRDRWSRLLDELVPDEPSLPGKVISARQAALAAISQLPAWSLSPLDWVASQAQARGVVIGEISGRNTRLEITPTGWRVVPRVIENRHEVVRLFNSGQTDALLLTRAAASGISLHAGSTFSDQRPRTLVEWGVAADPLVRMQFWGRVRRRDQVVEPDFESLAFDTPSERRLRARDERKRRQLSAHLGAGSDGELDLLSPVGESLVEEWAQENPGMARRLGVFRALPDDPVGRIDRIMARSLVLPEKERIMLMDRLDRGLAMAAAHWGASSEPSSMSSRRVRSTWWWGDPQALPQRVEGVMPWRLDWVERVWLPQPNTQIERAVQCLKEAQGEEGSAVLERWKQVEHGQRPRGARHGEQLRWVQAMLPALSRGAAVQVGNPVSGQPTRAMVLGVLAPHSQEPREWAFSQVAVSLLLVGYSQPLQVPLSALASDRHFKLGNMRARPEWFGEELTPTRAMVVEGNPLAAAAWGRRLGQGWSQSLHDEMGEQQIVWRLPPEYSWSSLQKLPRDLINVEQVFAFWREFPDEPLAAAIPLQQRCLAQPLPGAIQLKFDQETYRIAHEEWLDVGLSKMLSSPRQLREGEKTWVVRTLPFKEARRWFEGAANRGLGWRVAPRFAAWYETSCGNWFAKGR